jgi:NTP pyrophosphatase (non-canonical NTP hydrolase)
MELSKNAPLSDYQKLIKLLVVERGFDKETVSEVFMLLVEEVGELGKAIRKSSGMKTDTNSKQHDIAEETADILWLLCDLCNRLDIDLAQVFSDKELKNRSRNWT